MLPDKVRDLDRLRSLTSIRSRRELFDNALTFFDWGVTVSMRGQTVAAVDHEAGVFQPVLMPAFSAARRAGKPPGAKAKGARRVSRRPD
jgi:hypothetical protein